MADLAGKQAEAEQLRQQLRALRTQRESVALQAHNEAAEVRVDGELETLRRQIEQEQAALQNTGSVDDAKAAMAAAAAGATTSPSSVESDKVKVAPALLSTLPSPGEEK